MLSPVGGVLGGPCIPGVVIGETTGVPKGLPLEFAPGGSRLLPKNPVG